MSYVIHLWEHAHVTSWVDADRLLKRLSGQPAAPNPKFAQLSQGLLRAFPQQAGSPWSEGAPDGQVHERVWALGLDTRHLERVLPELVEQAIALGLTVYDGQSGEVFLPGRWRITPEVYEPLTWAPAAPAAPEPAAAGREAPLVQLEAQLRDALLPQLAPKGFALHWRDNKPSHASLAFVRSTPLGEQRIEVTPSAWSDQHWDLFLSCMLAPTLPADLLKWCEPQDTIPVVFETLPGAQDLYRHADTRQPFDASFRLLGSDRQQRFVRVYADWVLQQLVPVLDAAADLAGYLRIDGQPAEQQVVVQAAVAGLALAHCAGDTELAARAERYGAQRVPTPRVDLFRRRVAGLAGFPQHFGIYAHLR